MANLMNLGPCRAISFPIVGTALCGTTGFQSPADDYQEERIDLSKELVTNKANTFCWRLSGRSFEEFGIPDGSIGVFDYSLKPQVNNVVLVRLHDVVTLKIVRRINGVLSLTSGTSGYPIIPINTDEGVQIYGVLKHYVVSI